MAHEPCKIMIEAPPHGVAPKQLRDELRAACARNGGRVGFERIASVAELDDGRVAVTAFGLSPADRVRVADVIALHIPAGPATSELERDLQSAHDRIATLEEQVAELVERLDAEEKYTEELTGRLDWAAKVIEGLQAALLARPPARANNIAE